MINIDYKKVNIFSAEEGVELQDSLFKLGYKWASSEKEDELKNRCLNRGDVVYLGGCKSIYIEKQLSEVSREKFEPIMLAEVLSLVQ